MDIANNAMKAFAKSATAAAGAMYELGVSAIEYNAAMEQYELSFEMMLGSSEEAAEVMENLKNLSADTTFGFEDLASTTQLLINYGFTIEEAQDSLMMLGDISQGSADKLKLVAEAYGQMSSAGKVQLDDIQQLINAGFNPLQEISDSTGESVESLYHRISEGTLSVDEITDSMQRATSEGGAFFQSMEKQSQTVNGQLEMLKENFQILTGEVFVGVSEDIGEELLPMAQGWVDQLSLAFEEDGIVGLAGAIGNVLAEIAILAAEYAPQIVGFAVEVIQALLDGMQENLPQIMAGVVVIIDALIMGFLEILPQLLEVGAEAIVLLNAGMTESSPMIFRKIIEIVGNMVSTFIKNIPMLSVVGLEIITNLIISLLSNLPSFLTIIPDVAFQILNVFLAQAYLFFDVGTKFLANIIDALGGDSEGIKNFVINWVDNLVQNFKAQHPLISGIGKAIIDGIQSGMTSGWNGLMDYVDNLANSMLKAAKKALGIKSPSKEFAYIGRMCVAGWEQGTEDLFAADSVTKNVKATLGNIQAKLSGGTSGTHGGYTQVINVNREIATPDELARAVRVESRYGLMRGVAYGY